MESYTFTDINTAISYLEKHKKKKENKNTVVCVINFDKNTSEKDGNFSLLAIRKICSDAEE